MPACSAVDESDVSACSYPHQSFFVMRVNLSLSLTYSDKGSGTGCSVWTRPINLYQPRAMTRSINPDADSAALQGDVEADLSRHSSEFRSMAANNEDGRAPLHLSYVLACSLIYILARVSIFIPSSLKLAWISSKTLIKSITLIYFLIFNFPTWTNTDFRLQ